MSIESAKLFIEKVKNDEDFKNKVSAYATGKERMDFAKREGFDFTTAEITQASGGELSEEELEAVTGGVCGKLCIAGLGDVAIE